MLLWALLRINKQNSDYCTSTYCNHNTDTDYNKRTWWWYMYIVQCTSTWNGSCFRSNHQRNLIRRNKFWNIFSCHVFVCSRYLRFSEYARLSLYLTNRFIAMPSKRIHCVCGVRTIAIAIIQCLNIISSPVTTTKAYNFQLRQYFLCCRNSNLFTKLWLNFCCMHDTCRVCCWCVMGSHGYCSLTATVIHRYFKIDEINLTKIFSWNQWSLKLTA